MLAQQLVNAISLGGVYALFALGFTLIFGVLGVINLAHGAIFMLGAYAALQAVVLFKLPLGVGDRRGDHRHRRCRLAARSLDLRAAAGSPSAASGADDRHHRFGHFSQQYASQGIFGAENLRFPVHGMAAEGLQFGGVQVTWLEIQIILLAFVLMAVLLWWLKHTRMGCALRALAESPKAAALLGIDVEGLFRMTSVIAALLGGVAGVLIALYTNAVFPLMGQPMLHKGIAVVILGGMGDIRGALLGGFFLGLCRSLFRGLHRLDHARCRGLRSAVRDFADPAARRVRQCRPAARLRYFHRRRQSFTRHGMARHLLGDLQHPGAIHRHQRAVGLVDLSNPCRAGCLTVANAAFMGIGAYTAALLTLHSAVPFHLSLLLGALLPAAVALLLGPPTLRLSGVYLAMATLAFGEIVRIFMLNAEGSDRRCLRSERHPAAQPVVRRGCWR